MGVPRKHNAAIDTLRNTLAACLTFQQLVGAGDAPTAANSIHQRFLSDEYADAGTDMADPTRQPIDPYPRANLFDTPQHVRLGPNEIIDGMGMFTAFIQFLPFTAEQLSSWYGEAIFDPGERDHLMHARNIMIDIRNELHGLVWQPGYLSITNLTEDYYLAPPYCEGGQNIWHICYDIHWAGLP